MGYSKSKRAIRRVEAYLAQMVKSEAEIQFPAEEPSDFAFKLREGIKASRHFAVEDNHPVEPYASYSRLMTKFIIRVKGPMVICEPRDVVPLVKLRQTLGQVSIAEVKDTLGIIGAAITHKAPIMVFPNANKDTVEADRLNFWATNNDYYLVIAENHVTLTKENPGELAWRP